MRLAVVGILSAASLAAQDAPLAKGSVSFTMPDNSPVALMSYSTDQSRTSLVGAAVRVDFHMSLTLRNISAKRIHGITLKVVSQEVTLGGKASVAWPSLNIGPDEVFAEHIDARLMRPTQMAGGPLVEVSLDGVLFQDLSFFGPDLLNSRRTMTAMEREAQRDREYFKRILAQGPAALKQAMIASLNQQAEPRLGVRVIPHGSAVTSAATATPERAEQFAFLQMPDSPVQPVSGWAMVSGNEARAPRIEVRNTSSKAVKYVELGWLVRDQAGKQYMAASLPASDANLFLPAGKSAQMGQDTQLTFTREKKPVNIQGMTGFVSQVEFADGKVWVPNREGLAKLLLDKVMPPSAEEQRLSNLYVTKGVDALILELKKF
ncbi:conserved exported hypothetical protein [Candidatus Sulfopaludibacter sp. SbA3]|nr:conserved exported hypothetical protein [Candidatus Sulfopaludibacter sp. SbA3]